MSRPFSKFSNARREIVSDEPLGDDQLASCAPAIFTHTACKSRSEKYQHITTLDIHDRLTKEGFRPYRVVQQVARRKGKDDSQQSLAEARERQLHMKHMLLYRHPDVAQDHIISHGGIGQIGLVNDSRGMTSVKLFAGWFEFLCANGLFIGNVAKNVSIRHTGEDMVGRVIASMFEVMASLETVRLWREDLRSVRVNPVDAHEFAAEALKLRWEAEAPIYPAQLLARRRLSDDLTNLWGLYQVVQENMARGTHTPQAALDRLYRLPLADQASAPRPIAVRPVTAIDRNVKIEHGLSNLAEMFKR